MHRAQKAVALIFAIALLIVVLLKLFFAYLAPFICGGLIALVIDPLVGHLEQRGVGRNVAVTLVLVALGLVLALGLVSALTHLSGELLGLQARLELQRELIIQYDQWSIFFEKFLKGLPPQVAEVITKQLAALNLKLQELAQEALLSLGGLPQFLFGLMMALFSAYFLSRDKRDFVRWLFLVLPESWQGYVVQIKGEVLSGVLGYLRAQVVILLLSTAVSVAGLHLLGINYAWVLGILTGVLEFLPVVGPGVVYLPLIIYHVGRGQALLSIALGVNLTVIVLLRQLVEPQLLGRSTGVHPLLFAASLYLGLAIYGSVGLFLGPMLLLILRAVCTVILVPNFHM